MVYILHLDTPLHHAKHYTGFSTNNRTLAERLEHHRRGTAHCKFTEVLREKGIGFQLARVFPNASRTFERMLKNTKQVSRYCPICNPNPQEYHPRRET